MIEVKKRIDIRNLTVPDVVQAEKKSFDPDQFLMPGDLNIFEKIMDKNLQENHHWWLENLHVLKILSPERYAEKEMPAEYFKRICSNISRAKYHDMYYITNTSAAVLLAAPEKRSQLPINNKVIRKINSQITEAIEGKHWGDVVHKYMNFMIIAPDKATQVGVGEDIKQGIKEKIQSADLGYASDYVVYAKALFPQRSDIYNARSTILEEIKEKLQDRNFFDLNEHDPDPQKSFHFFKLLANAVLISADTVQVRRDSGIVYYNTPKPVHVVSNKAIPFHRRF